MKQKLILHPESVKVVTGVLDKELNTEPLGVCTHPIDIRFWLNGTSKCMGCGEMIIT